MSSNGRDGIGTQLQAQRGFAGFECRVDRRSGLRRITLLGTIHFLREIPGSADHVAVGVHHRHMLQGIGGKAHNCIGFRLLGSGSLYEWDVTDGERHVKVKTTSTAAITDATFGREFALQGIGIAYIFEPLVRADLPEGRLRWVLPRASLQEAGLFAYFPRRAALAPKLRAFIEASRSVVS
jgi:DNA-binding transcriptional LysR family regulator